MIIELTAKEFDEFANTHELSNYHQSSNYATLMSKCGYDHKYLGFRNSSGKLVGATLLLIKKIKYIFKYAYAPKGFLIDYKNKELVEHFTNAIKDYAQANKIIFIKLNPEIPTYKYIDKNKKIELDNTKVKDILDKNKYIKLKDNIYFESLLPRFNAILDLKRYNEKKISKTNRNKINNAVRKGLEIEITNKNKIKDVYPFIERKKVRRNLVYYKNYFQLFNETDQADIFLVRINYDLYLNNSKNIFEAEQEKNKKLTDRLFKNNTEENLKRKMESDNLLTTYKNDIINATYSINSPEKYIAGAFCIKHKNHVHIVISGYNELYGNMNANYFLHNEIFKYYKKDFDYIDLNGITGDFTVTNPYYGLNEFKLGFNPNVYEFIGEYDLVINEKLYNFMLSTGILQNEFKK